MSEQEDIKIMQTKVLDSILLAKYIINKLIDKGLSISHLKLQKLIYFINAWHLAYFDRPLIKDDFQAWVHGPVSKKVWNHFKREAVLNDKLTQQEYTDCFECGMTADQRDLIDDVIEEYSGDSAYRLEKITHAEPMWITARGDLPYYEHCYEKMDMEAIKKHYRSLMD